MNDTRFDPDVRSDLIGQAASRRLLLRRVAGGAAAAAAGSLRLAPAVAGQETTESAATAPLAAYRFRLGQLSLRVFDDGSLAFPHDWMAANARPRALADAVSDGDLPPDVTTLRINALLIETGTQLVLVDTGFGAFEPAAGKLPMALQAEGIAPEEIDLVLLTHLHPDHVGRRPRRRGQAGLPQRALSRQPHRVRLLAGRSQPG